MKKQYLPSSSRMAAMAAFDSEGAFACDQIRVVGIIDGLSLHDSRCRAVWSFRRQDAGRQIDRNGRRTEAVLRRRRGRPPGCRQRLAAHQEVGI